MKYCTCLMANMLNKAILATAVKDIRATRLYSQIMSPSPVFTKQCSGHISTILYLGESHLIVAERLLRSEDDRDNMIN